MDGFYLLMKVSVDDVSASCQNPLFDVYRKAVLGCMRFKQVLWSYRFNVGKFKCFATDMVIS